MTEQKAIEIIKREEQWESNSSISKAFNMAIEALEEIQQYRAIGTPDECMAAVEKQTAKKVKDISMVRDNEEYIGRIGKCPCCEDIVVEDTLYCDCGQKLDWSDNN